MPDLSQRMRGPDGRMVRMTPEHYTCAECGERFPHKRSGRTKHLYCSRKCAAVVRSRRAAANRKPAPLPVCRCGQPFERKSNETYCSASCPSRPPRYLRMPLQVRACRGCGETVTGTAARRYCDRCNRRRSRAIARSLRRVRERASAERIDPEVVFKRDGWRCYICGCATPASLRGTTHDDAPEMDHVVPLSKGGAHTYDNVRCACRVCNWVKSDGPIEACGVGMPVKMLTMSTS